MGLIYTLLYLLRQLLEVLLIFKTVFRVLLKETLEEMGLKKEEVTIASLDAINIYPLIKLATIKKAVRFFARKLTSEVKKTINLCLDLIQFGMSSTLISFDGEYYKYHGGEREEQGLAIGGY